MFEQTRAEAKSFVSAVWYCSTSERAPCWLVHAVRMPDLPSFVCASTTLITSRTHLRKEQKQSSKRLMTRPFTRCRASSRSSAREQTPSATGSAKVTGHDARSRSIWLQRPTSRRKEALLLDPQIALHTVVGSYQRRLLLGGKCVRQLPIDKLTRFGGREGRWT